MFLQAKGKLGDLAHDECYGYTLLIGMGSANNIDNLQKVKIKEYISIYDSAGSSLYRELRVAFFVNDLDILRRYQIKPACTNQLVADYLKRDK